jgi:hypothetical protein
MCVEDETIGMGSNRQDNIQSANCVIVSSGLKIMEAFEEVKYA